MPKLLRLPNLNWILVFDGRLQPVKDARAAGLSEFYVRQQIAEERPNGLFLKFRFASGIRELHLISLQLCEAAGQAKRDSTFQ